MHRRVNSTQWGVKDAPFDLAEVKLGSPSLRPGTVAKGEVIQLCVSDAPLVTVVAPPGYGKTTQDRVGARLRRRRRPRAARSLSRYLLGFCLDLDAAVAAGSQQGVVVALVLVGVRGGKASDRLVE